MKPGRPHKNPKGSKGYKLPYPSNKSMDQVNSQHALPMAQKPPILIKPHLKLSWATYQALAIGLILVLTGLVMAIFGYYIPFRYHKKYYMPHNQVMTLDASPFILQLSSNTTSDSFGSQMLLPETVSDAPEDSGAYYKPPKSHFIAQKDRFAAAITNLNYNLKKAASRSTNGSALIASDNDTSRGDIFGPYYWTELRLTVLSYAGPCFMGVGCIILVVVYVVTFESRDRAIKLNKILMCPSFALKGAATTLASHVLNDNDFESGPTSANFGRFSVTNVVFNNQNTCYAASNSSSPRDLKDSELQAPMPSITRPGLRAKISTDSTDVKSSVVSYQDDYYQICRRGNNEIDTTIGFSRPLESQSSSSDSAHQSKMMTKFRHPPSRPLTSYEQSSMSLEEDQQLLHVRVFREQPDASDAKKSPIKFSVYGTKYENNAYHGASSIARSGVRPFPVVTSNSSPASCSPVSSNKLGARGIGGGAFSSSGSENSISNYVKLFGNPDLPSTSRYYYK